MCPRSFANLCECAHKRDDDEDDGGERERQQDDGEEIDALKDIAGIHVAQRLRDGSAQNR